MKPSEVTDEMIEAFNIVFRATPVDPLRHAIAAAINAMPKADDARDAARWRWMRHKIPGPWYIYRKCGLCYSEGRRGVDEAVDAAMKFYLFTAWLLLVIVLGTFDVLHALWHLCATLLHHVLWRN